MTSLTELHKEAARLTAQIKAEEEARDKTLKDLTAQRRACREAISMAGSALDLEKIKLAEQVIYVRGSFKEAGDDRHFTVNKAISVLTSDSGRFLWREYVGTKSYDRWHGQYIDAPYGMGPTHGHVIFAIGLNQSIRDHRACGNLTPEEIEACLYYLGALELIQESKAAAA
ncbi:hypothetical protein A8B82_15185 [Sulfitobacter sp. EhC04]|uniref:hypothetical protein n=1 Tax=Sulfitobacter sp. EhC04 TaxID=1849168 RepID=UPI0007F41107|nr:hypothetical protein [Sulfitobacter sp. EhC04]OAN76736.1 hypothetical protein A8B82_15185 [Sulfitobacter sp. EhC04]